jgi:hypothetical protein
MPPATAARTAPTAAHLRIGGSDRRPVISVIVLGLLRRPGLSPNADVIGHPGRVLRWEQLIVDARAPVALGTWWADALGWVVVNDDPDEFEIRSAPDQFPGLLFALVPEAKLAKNRLHLDLRPDDRDGEAARLISLGAERIDVGQGEPSWIVLADPEGNEFCVLRSHRDA